MKDKKIEELIDFIEYAESKVEECYKTEVKIMKDKKIKMLDIVKKYKDQEKQIQQLRLVINDYIVDLAKANKKIEEYKTMYEFEQKIVVADELKIMKALEYAKILNKRIPVKHLIEILEGVKE